MYLEAGKITPWQTGSLCSRCLTERTHLVEASCAASGIQIAVSSPARCSFANINRVATIRLDSVTRFHRGSATAHHDTEPPRCRYAASGQQTMKPVNRKDYQLQAQATAATAELCRHGCTKSRGGSQELRPVAPHRSWRLPRTRRLLHVQSDMYEIVDFGPSPMHKALCRPSGTTLDTCMPRDGSRRSFKEHRV
jgi:hypothetical protein